MSPCKACEDLKTTLTPAVSRSKLQPCQLVQRRIQIQILYPEWFTSFSGIFWKGCVEKEVDFVVDTCDHDHVVYGQSFPYDKRRKIR